MTQNPVPVAVRKLIALCICGCASMLARLIVHLRACSHDLWITAPASSSTSPPSNALLFEPEIERRWGAGRSHEGSVTWGLGGGLGALMSRSHDDSPDPADIPLPLPWILARLRAKGLALVAEGKFFAESEITGKSKDQGTTKDKDTVKSKSQGKSKDKDKAKSKVQRKSKDKDKLKGKVQGKSTDKDKVKSKVKGKGTRCALTRENQLQPLSRWRLAVDQARSHLLLELTRCARAGEPLPYIDWTNRRGGALHREALRFVHLPSPELPQGVS